jgi:hypothetical protein
MDSQESCVKNNNKRMKNLMIIITANDINSNENSQIKSDSLNMKIECIRDFLSIFSIVFVKWKLQLKIR